MKKKNIGSIKTALESLHLNLYVSEVIITVNGYVIEQNKERLEIDNVTRAVLEKEKAMLRSQTMKEKMGEEVKKS